MKLKSARCPLLFNEWWLFTITEITCKNNVFEISNVHNERNINLKSVILVRIRLNGFNGDCKSKKW